MIPSCFTEGRILPLGGNLRQILLVILCSRKKPHSLHLSWHILRCLVTLASCVKDVAKGWSCFGHRQKDKQMARPKKKLSSLNLQFQGDITAERFNFTRLNICDFYRSAFHNAVNSANIFEYLIVCRWNIIPLNNFGTLWWLDFCDLNSEDSKNKIHTDMPPSFYQSNQTDTAKLGI
jgi:hypothetical protein